ncbi:MAG TPA: Lrp/AsnC family transcriptional regulator [Spirochaetia bacterium]|nr:Lrp/AsnC family transcriptional regulator [Spirochaetia bacterium]
MVVDEIDRKILDLLQCNAKLSNAEIAEKVGLTVSSVHERVKKLERRGIIKGYVAVVDPDKLGKQLLAFVRLTVGSHEEAAGPIGQLCQAEPDILECHNVAGEDCYILKVRAEGPKQLERLLSAIRGGTDTSRSVTNIVLSTHKESTRIAPAPQEQGD